MRVCSQQVYGGTNINSEKSKLKGGAITVLVATPGRLLDHLKNSGLTGQLDRLRTLVMDEADQLLEMGFRPAIEEILSESKGVGGWRSGPCSQHTCQGTPNCIWCEIFANWRVDMHPPWSTVNPRPHSPPIKLLTPPLPPSPRTPAGYLPRQRQTLLFSATMPQGVQQVAGLALRQGYSFIDTIKEEDTATNVQVKMQRVESKKFAEICQQFDFKMYEQMGRPVT
jgi:superfamily II DNA/RNA helicase